MGGVLASRLGRRPLRPRRYLADVGAERVARRAFVDVPQVADENNGPAGERANRVKFLLRDWDSKFTAAWIPGAAATSVRGTSGQPRTVTQKVRVSFGSPAPLDSRSVERRPGSAPFRTRSPTAPHHRG
jgi:hypothetical protein